MSDSNQRRDTTNMWERMNEKRHEGGFTLIELLIVIIILAILAAIVVFAVGTTGTNAKTSACSADAKTFETALEDYKAEVGNYPLIGNGQTGQATGTYGLLGNPSSASGTWLDAGGQTIGPFMRSLPLTQHYQIMTDGNGGVFVIPATTNGGIAISAVTATELDGTTAPNGTVGAVSTTHTGDGQPINFDATPTTAFPNNVCADGNVVQ